MNVYAIFVIVAASYIEVSIATDERTLYNALFGRSSGYTTKVRPKQFATQTLHVYVEYELNQIQELDEKNQVLHSVGFFTAKWRDEYLSWKHRKYGNITRLVVSPRDVWLPDFGVRNSADTFYHDEFTTDFRVEIHHDGNITWSFGGIFQTMCQLDNTYYPLDLQKCSLDIENWAYTGVQVDLHHRKTKVDMENFQQHGIWEVTDTELEKEWLTFNSHPGESFPQLKFDLLLKRKSTYYVLNILIPCAFVIIVALAVYWLPPDAGEKVSFGVTVLLAFSVFQLVIAENTPQNSDFKPKLSLLVLSIMGLSSFSVVTSILILYLHHKSTATRVPRWLRVLAFKGVATVMCMRSSVPDVEDDERKVAPDEADAESVEGAPLNEKGSGELWEILTCLKFMTKRMKEKDNDEGILEEWQALGKVIDRCLFWLSLIAIVVISGVLLGQPDTDHHN